MQVESLAQKGVQQVRKYLASPSPRKLKAQFWRGGTSNGVLVEGEDLEEWRWLKERHPQTLNLNEAKTLLQPVFQAIMGSPDPYGRQLNGMGGGLSSLSKAVIVEKSNDGEADLDYLFLQIGIKDGKLDLAGNCGNMSSAVAPFAVNRDILDVNHKLNWRKARTTRGAVSNATRLIHPLSLRLRNLNTDRIIKADFEVARAEDTEETFYQEQGDYVMDGVPGYASPITLSFTSPGGAKTGKAIPTGNPVDTLQLDGFDIRASLLDISNPGVFIDGRDVGWNALKSPEQLNADVVLMGKLEQIRRAGASMMGLDPETSSVPKVVLLFPPTSDDVDISCQAVSMEQAHKAVPMTLGLNLGVACKIDGTIANALARQRNAQKTVVGHPSGRVEVGAEIGQNGEIISAQVIRTARCLFEGEVNVQMNEEWTDM